MKKETTTIEVWVETRDEMKIAAKSQGISMKKLIDMWAKKKRIK